MADLSRRALVAALPVAAVPAIALPAAVTVIPTVSNLTRLLDIERTLQQFAADIEATFPANIEAFREWNRLRRGWHIPQAVRYGTPRERYRAEQAKIRWDRRLARAKVDAGLASTEGRLRDLRNDRDELVGSVCSIPATDLATLQVKARMAQLHNNLLGSVAADVLEMTGWANG